MYEKDLLPASIRSAANLKCISKIFSDRSPCCLAEGLLESVYKEIIDTILIAQI